MAGHRWIRFAILIILVHVVVLAVAVLIGYFAR
jgi:hypothetical protein